MFIIFQQCDQLTVVLQTQWWFSTYVYYS